MERLNGLVAIGVRPWSQGSWFVLCVCVTGRGQIGMGIIFVFKDGLDLNIFKKE